MVTKNERARSKLEESKQIGPVRARDREENFLPDIQLTLISVITGAALSFLAAEFKGVIEQGQMVSNLLPAVVTFLVICAFWYSFLIGVTYLRWKLSLFDTFLYFALGLIENMMVQFISNMSAWCISAGLFAILTGFTYWSDSRQLNPRDYTNQAVYQRHVRDRRIRAMIAILAGLLNIGVVYFIPYALFWIGLLNLGAVCFILYSLKHGVDLDQEAWYGRSR